MPIRVLWISCVGEKGGAEVYLLNLLRALNPDRVVASVVLLRDGPFREELDAAGISVHVFREHRMRNLPMVVSAIHWLSEIIQQESIDIIHSNAFRAMVYGAPAARIHGIPHFLSAHTYERRNLLNRLILQFPADLVLANCHRTAEFFLNQGYSTTLLWPSVDPGKYDRFSSRKHLEVKLNLPASGRWICQGSRLQHYKGQHHTVQLISDLPERFHDVHAIIMGGMLFGAEPEYLESLKEMACRLGVQDRVHFTGHLDNSEDVLGIIRASEFMVHPAHDEDFGLIVAEAYCMCKPVVAFAAVGPSEIIIDSQTGFLVTIGDQALLNSRVIELLDHPQDQKNLGEEGRSRVLENYSNRHCAELMEGFYHCS